MSAIKSQTKHQGLQNLMQRAESAFHSRQYQKCISISSELLSRHPLNTKALLLFGHSSLQLGHTNEALSSFIKVKTLEPDNLRVTLNIGRLYIKTSEYNKALEILEQWNSEFGWDQSVEYLKALCLSNIGMLNQAIESYTKIVERDPHMVHAYIKLADLLRKADKKNYATDLINLAIKVNPNAHELLHTQAKFLATDGRNAASLALYEQLENYEHKNIEIVVDHAEILARMKRHSSAETKFKQALAMEETHRRTLTCYARWLSGLKRLDEAIALYIKIIEKNPNDSMVLTNIGNIYGMKRDFINAKKYYGLAYHANPDAPRAAGSYLYAMSFLCEWKERDLVEKAILTDTQHTKLKAFQSVVFKNDAKAQLAYAIGNAQREFKTTGIIGPLKKYEGHQKIRLGYYSSDFYNHATVMLIEGLLKAHDRSIFELHAFSLDITRHDEYTKRIKMLFDKYHEVSSLSDGAVTYLSRQLEIDIAIDLKGFTEGSRTRVFSERAAPVQINYLGYPGTMGDNFIDYIIADNYIIPADKKSFYSEKIIYMPDCYQPNNPNRPTALIDASNPRPLELPEKAFVFCSFNNTYKLNPEIFDIWINILRQTPESVLWLLKTTPAAEGNILDYVARTDIDVSRIIFAKYLPEEQHLRRLAHADLFLDTFPCNAHTTASDALWAGVPLITRSGETFASRVAGSILHAVGLEELIVDSEAAYEALALKIYHDRSYHQDLKHRVKEGIAHGALYDAQRYTRHFERALIEIHERHHQDLPPQDLEVTELADMPPMRPASDEPSYAPAKAA